MSVTSEHPLLQLWRQQLESSSALPWQARAFEQLEERGLPSRRDEPFRYLPLSELAGCIAEPQVAAVTRQQIAHLFAPESTGLQIVLLDGKLEPQLSDLSSLPATCQLLSLSEALDTFGSYLQTARSRALREESDPMVLLNLALASEGAFLYIPPGVICDRPVQLLQLISGASSWTTPRLDLFLGKEAQLTLLSTHATLAADAKWGSASSIEAMLNPSASLTLLEDMRHHPSEWAFHSIRIRQREKSRSSIFSCSMGARSARSSIEVQLLGGEAESSCRALSLLEGNRQSHLHFKMHHVAPSARSLQQVRSLLWDHAQLSFEGKIYVEPEAQKTDSYQRSEHLLLGEGAAAYTKPNLEIFADDVKASHGASTARLDGEQLLYLRSRGLPEEEAVALLLHGFCGEILDQLPLPSIAMLYRERVARRIGG